MGFESTESFEMSNILWLIPFMIVLASTIIELQYDALFKDPSIAIIVLDAHPEFFDFSSRRKNDLSASSKFGNSGRIESISYVLVNDD